jgi:pyruvate dehydrogenase E1 component beta subunit
MQSTWAAIAFNTLVIIFAVAKNIILYNIMREIQFREALREAMVEEMRNDDTIYLMGEEVAEYNGAYKVSQGMLDEFGANALLIRPSLN